MLFWLGIVWRTMFQRSPLKTTTQDKTPVLIEQRCDKGHLFVYVVPRYVALTMKVQLPAIKIVQIDKELVEEAQLIANEV